MAGAARCKHLSVSGDRDADDEKEFESTHLIAESDVLEN
jgi:hypothetical protein